MSDIRKLLNILSESSVGATSSGSVATVEQAAFTQSRAQTVEPPAVLEYGNWENSALTTSKKLKKTRTKARNIVKKTWGEDAPEVNESRTNQGVAEGEAGKPIKPGATFRFPNHWNKADVVHEFLRKKNAVVDVEYSYDTKKWTVTDSRPATEKDMEQWATINAGLPGVKEQDVAEDPVTGGLIGGALGLAAGAKGAYHAAKKGFERLDDPNSPKNISYGKEAGRYVKDFVKGIVDPRTYIPQKKQADKQDVAEGADTVTKIYRVSADLISPDNTEGKLTKTFRIKAISEREAVAKMSNLLKRDGYQIEDIYCMGLADDQGVAEDTAQKYSVTIDAIDHGVLGAITVSASSPDEAKRKVIEGVKKAWAKRGDELMVRRVIVKPVQGVAEGLVEAIASGNYSVGLEDIGKRVTVNGDTGGKTGYVLVSIRYSPRGLDAEIVDRKNGSTGWYNLTDISKSNDQHLGEQGMAEAIPYALSAANANAEYERTKTFVPRGYKGRVDIEVSGQEKYRLVMTALKKLAQAEGQHIEAGLSHTKMSIFSKTMDSDALNKFVDMALEEFDQGVTEMNNRTPADYSREQEANSPEELTSWIDREISDKAKYKKAKAANKNLGVAEEQIDEVAGAQKCWPGHRKVGTQPGTGKNAGKRVNKCQKISKK